MCSVKSHLNEDFDVVALISLRSLQQKSLEDGVVECIGGKENYDRTRYAGNPI